MEFNFFYFIHYIYIFLINNNLCLFYLKVKILLFSISILDRKNELMSKLVFNAFHRYNILYYIHILNVNNCPE